MTTTDTTMVLHCVYFVLYQMPYIERVSLAELQIMATTAHKQRLFESFERILSAFIESRGIGDEEDNGVRERPSNTHWVNVHYAMWVRDESNMSIG